MFGLPAGISNKRTCHDAKTTLAAVMRMADAPIMTEPLIAPAAAGACLKTHLRRFAVVVTDTGNGNGNATPISRRIAMPTKCSQCGTELPEHMDRQCGAYICDGCGNHEGLARCFCGWSADGGDGRAQLEEAGETIDPEPTCFGDGMEGW